MKIKNTFKRAVALLTSLLIVISATSGAIYSFAAVNSADYTIDTKEITNDAVEAMGDTIISSVKIESTLDGGATYRNNTPAANMLDKLTDKSVTTQMELRNKPVTVGTLNKGYFHDYELKDAQNQDVSKQASSIKAKYLDGTERKVRVTLTLTGKSNIDNIILAHTSGSGEAAGALSIANYAIFAADTSEDLYNKDKASFYHLYDNTTAKKKYQNYTFNKNALTGVKYVGIEIYNPHIDWADRYITQNGVDIFYPRLNMFNVYGTAVPETVSYDDGEFLTATEKGDLKLLSTSIGVKSYRNGVEYASGKNVSAIIDEDASTSLEFMQSGAKTHEYAFYDKGGVKFKEGGVDVDVTVNFTIEVQPKSIIKKLVFLNSSATAGDRAKEYEIYAANSKDDLFKAGNCIEHVVNNGLKKRQIINIVDPEGLTAKYVGFRVIEGLDPATFEHFNTSGDNYAVPRIRQIGVYGETKNEIENAEITRLTDRNVPSDIGTRLTGNNTVIDVRYYNNNQPNQARMGTRANLCDGDATTGYEANDTGVVFTEGGNKVVKTYEDGYYYEVEYDLGTYDTIKKVYVAHHSNSSKGVRAQRYEVYASNDQTKLWEEASKIAYVITNDTVAQVINLKEAVKARFVGLRTLDTVRANTSLGANEGYLRLYEFSVYGEKGGDTNFELAEDTTTRTLPAGNSVVKRMSVKYKGPYDAQANLFTPVFDTSLQPSYSVLEGLTTLNANSGIRIGGLFAKAEGDSAIIYRDGTTAYTDVIYTLDGKCDISDIFVSEHSLTMWKIAYKLYVSDDEATLFSGTPIYTYDDTSANYFQHYKTAGLRAKYVGLRITAATVNDNYSEYSDYGVSDLYPRLFGFGVLGTADTSSRAPQEGASLPIPTGESAVENASAYYYDGTERKPVGMSDSKLLYDGTLLTGNARGNDRESPFAYKEGGETKYYTDRYMDIVLNLKGSTKLSDVYIAHLADSALMTKEYALYVGDDKGTLFNGAPYYVCDNNDSKQSQHYTFDGVTAKYVGIRITKAHGNTGRAAQAENCYVRLLEFNAFGTVIPDLSYKKITNLTSHKFPNGLNFDGLKFLNHKDTNIKAKSTWADTTMSNPEQASMSSFENMADGDFKTQNMLDTRFAEYDTVEKTVTDYTKNKVRYQTVWYDLKSEADLSFINIAFPTNPIWAAGYYEVYISNDKDALFEGDAYACVDNYTLRKDQGVDTIMNVIAFDKTDDVPDVARYVGIKIYNPINVDLGAASLTVVNDKQNYIYGRIQELQIYGKYLDESFDPTAAARLVKTTKSFGDLSKLPEVYGDNLLSSKNAKPTINGGKDVTSNHKRQLNPIIDRKGAELDGKHVDFSDITAASEYVIYFKLTGWELTQVNGFVFQGIAAEHQSYYASDYEVYVVEEREDVATEKPVFHYNTDDYPASNGQIIEFPEGKQPQGNWLVFKLNNPVYTAQKYDYMRLSVLYAWGEEAIVRGVPGNIAENMPCDISFLNGKDRTPVSEKNLTPKELANITDSITHVDKDGLKSHETNLETYGTIDTKGKGRDTLEMVYNLCSDSKIDKIMVSALIDNNTGFKTMKVYASRMLQGVYDEDSLIWTYKVSSKGVINPTKTFKNAKEMRYVRFVFEETRDDVILYTIDLIGMDNQKMKTRNLSSSLTRENLTVERIDLKTGVHSFYSNMNNALLEAVTNGIDTDFLSFEEGEVGKTGYSLIIDLGDLKTISKLELIFNYGFEEYWAKKINVFVFENKEQLSTAKKADYTFNPQKMSGNIKEISMRPRLARFERLDFVSFSKLKYFKTPEGTYKITSAIADVKIIGTKVKGMQRDEADDRLISFIDKKTKAEISLVKLDENDIFTNAVSARLVPEKATNWQMSSLESNNFKIVDKTVYKVELLDLYGNVVTDIGERMIQVRFPIKKSEKGKMLIGDASNKTEVVGLEAYEVDNWICANVSKNQNGDTKVALLKLTTSTDPYWSEIGELEDFEVEEEEEYRDETWYDSIHTTDGRFVVTPINDTYESGLKFTATDITTSKAYSDYYSVLEMATPDKQVAVFYDMKLTRNGVKVNVADGAVAEIAYAMPNFVVNGYTDLEAYHIDELGTVTPLAFWEGYNENEFVFQLEKMGQVAIVGTKLDGAEAGVIVGDSPETGESRAATAAVVSLMTAAAFVVTLSAKKKATDKK